MDIQPVYSTGLSADWTLLYDSECQICTRFASLAQRFIPSGIDIIPLQNFSLESIHLSMDDLMKEVHLIGPGKTVYAGKDAVHRLILLVPSLKPLKWMIDSQPGKTASKAVYASISHFRRCRRC